MAANDVPSILVVDDDKMTVELMGSVLKALGFSPVLTAPDGERGFAKFEQEKPDIVVTDLRMEPMDGLTLMKRLRDPMESHNPLVPVMMISGHTDVKAVLTARDAGVNEFLAKPLTAKRIFDRVADIVERPRPFVMSEKYFGPDRRRVEKQVAQDRRDPNSAAPPAPGVRVIDPNSKFAKAFRTKSQGAMFR